MLTHFSLFSGIGGIDLAAEWAGFETVGQCEWADYPTKVLEKHWPDVPRWRDVKDVTAESIRERGIGEIALLSGGFPCQPHSVAGKRQGSNDERDLWGEVARLICEVKPRWFLGENVPVLFTTEDGRFFGRILNDLGALGYNAGWCCYGADRIGAIHKRERIFIIANSYGGRFVEYQRQQKEVQQPEQCELQREKIGKSIMSELIYGITNVAYSDCEHVERFSKDEIQGFQKLQGEFSTRGVEEWRERCSIYQPKLCRTYNGIPNQVDRLKCLGNAVVPQQVYPILKAIYEIESSGW